MKLTLILGIIALTPLLHAQPPADAKPPAIRAESREVEIDVAVTSKKATSADGLTADDFTVKEDGKVQKIDRIQSAHRAASPKHIVLYFDLYTTNLPSQDGAILEKAVESFIDSTAGPDRSMAVMSMTQLDGARVLQNFTMSAGLLVRAVASRFANWPQFPGLLRYPLGDSLAAACRSMATASGDKAMIVLGGFNATNGAFGTAPIHDVNPPISRAIRACNDANVRVYAVVVDRFYDFRLTSRKPLNEIDQPPPHIQKQIPSAHSELAAQTGGLAFNITPDLKDRLTDAAREPDYDYRLFYTPPPSKDGVCHKLAVSMRSPDLSARTKNGYCTATQAEAAGGIAHAVSGTANTLNATMQLPYFYLDTNRASVRLAADFLPAGMKFDNDKKGLHGEMNIAGAALRQDGTVAARFSESLDIHQENQQSAGDFMKSPYHYARQFYLAPGQYMFQLEIAVGPNAARIEAPLNVDPWKPDSPAIASLALSTETRPAPEFTAGPILEGQGPLVAAGQRFVLAAGNVLEKSGPAYFYTEIYDPVLSAANPQPISPSTLEMEYCIVDRNTGKQAECSGMVSLQKLIRLGNPVVPFGTRLPVEQLPAGSYRLEVRAEIPANRETITRSIDFELK